MQKSIIIVFILILSSTFSFAQSNINNYKYIIVPKQYEFQKSEDSYRINSLTKFLFERAGFIVFFSTDTFPSDLATNSCLALKAMINNNSGIFNTKLKIDLVDCYNKTVFSTHEAKSKVKDYEKAYQTVVREAFVDIEALNYSYKSITNVKEENNITEEVIIKEVKEVEVKEELPKVSESKTSEETKIINVEVAATPINNKVEEIEASEIKLENAVSTTVSIEGTYLFDTWGKSNISKNNNEYTVIGGDENVELATIYKTSKPTIYIIKWRAFKQPQLIEIDVDGNLNVDTATGKKVYKKI